MPEGYRHLTHGEKMPDRRPDGRDPRRRRRCAALKARIFSIQTGPEPSRNRILRSPGAADPRLPAICAARAPPSPRRWSGVALRTGNEALFSALPCVNSPAAP